VTTEDWEDPPPPARRDAAGVRKALDVDRAAEEMRNARATVRLAVVPTLRLQIEVLRHMQRLLPLEASREDVDVAILQIESAVDLIEQVVDG